MVMIIKKMNKINYILTFSLLILYSCTESYLNVDYIDSHNYSHSKFLKYCSDKIKEDYYKIANKKKDSLSIYAIGFSQNSKIIINAEKEYAINISTSSLIHDRYLNYVKIPMNDIQNKSSLHVCVKLDLPKDLDIDISDNYNFKIDLDKLDIREYNSLVIRIKEKDNDKIAEVSFSKVDERVFEKLKKNCKTR